MVAVCSGKTNYLLLIFQVNIAILSLISQLNLIDSMKARLIRHDLSIPLQIEVTSNLLKQFKGTFLPAVFYFSLIAKTASCAFQRDLHRKILCELYPCLLALRELLKTHPCCENVTWLFISTHCIQHYLLAAQCLHSIIFKFQALVDRVFFPELFLCKKRVLCHFILMSFTFSEASEYQCDILPYDNITCLV